MFDHNRGYKMWMHSQAAHVKYWLRPRKVYRKGKGGGEKHLEGNVYTMTRDKKLSLRPFGFAPAETRIEIWMPSTKHTHDTTKHTSTTAVTQMLRIWFLVVVVEAAQSGPQALRYHRTFEGSEGREGLPAAPVTPSRAARSYRPP